MDIDLNKKIYVYSIKINYKNFTCIRLLNNKFISSRNSVKFNKNLVKKVIESKLDKFDYSYFLKDIYVINKNYINQIILSHGYINILFSICNLKSIHFFRLMTELTKIKKIAQVINFLIEFKSFKKVY